MSIRVTLLALLVWEVAFAVNHADRFGQPEEMSFPGKVTAEAELQADAKDESGRLGSAPFVKPGHDAHGGRIEEGIRLKATGFFRLEEIGGRWWFVTPEGHRFFLIGCDGCDFREGGYYTPLKDPEGREREEFAHLALPGRGEIPTLYRGPDKFNFLAWNLSRKYGADFQARADDVVRRRLAAWGFNSTAKWGWGWKLKGVPYFEDARIPDHKVYFGGWPHGLRIARGRYADMYHPDFPAAADKAAQQAAARRRNDPDLIAYAIDNENGWNRETLGWMLKAKDGDAGSFAKRAFFDFVARRRGVSSEKVASSDLEQFTAEEKNGFIREASLTIHRILTAAYKRHDPNHLFMAEANSISSARAWIEGQALSPMDFIAMHEYNIESIGWYACNLDFMRAHGKPFAILEYSFTGVARGMAPYKSTTDCLSEKARGLAYRNYTEHAAQHPLCLGLGYFVMYDQPFTKRSIPGESHHFGLVSQQDRPYMDMIEEVKLSNARLFDLHAGTISAPFALDGFSGILEFEPCIMTMRRQFVPGSIPSNVTCECNSNGREALFNGNKSHLKINSDIYLTPGVNLFGTIDLSGEWRGKTFSSTFFCWNRIADAPDWPVFEERICDGRKTRCKAKRTLLWKGKDFSMYRYELPPRDVDRQISVGIDVRNETHSWAALLAAAEVFAVANGSGYDDVDPFWGSGGTQSPKAEGMAFGWTWLKAQTGNTHPGAVRPFGWVSACAYSGAYPTGYGRFGVSSGGPAPERLKKPSAFGFTHFHHSGTGYIGKFYNLFLFSPHAPGRDISHASPLADEKAAPGHYAASLPAYGASFELAALPFAACHRYHFPDGKGVIDIDVTAAGYRRDIAGGHAKYEEHASVEKMEKTSDGWRGSVTIDGTRIFFDVRVTRGRVVKSEAYDGHLAIAIDGAKAGTAIAFAYESAELAAKRAGEAVQLGFDAAKKAAVAEWSRRLSRIKAHFADPQMRRRFYSTLYHSLVKPTDSGGKWLDFVTFWDVYRTQLPLVMSTQPDIARPMLLSLLTDSERLGYIPNYQLVYSRPPRNDEQATSLALFVLADGFFRGMLTKDDYPRIKAAAKREFADTSVEKRSPSHTIDISGAYRAIAFVAEACGDAAYAAELKEASGIWRKAYDPATGYLHKDAKYYEGDNRTYSFRPHPGMAARIALAGGMEKFDTMLDDFFAVGYAPKPGEKERIIRWGKFEGFNNESDIDSPFTYLWCGRADRMAEVIDAGRRYRFTDGEGGCPGNNDSGGMSAWFVQACLGVHPISGTPYCVLGSPAVDSAEVEMSRGTLRVRVERESAKSIYPKGYSFAGRDFREPWLPTAELEKGGEFVFRLADCPPASPSPIPAWY